MSQTLPEQLDVYLLHDGRKGFGEKPPLGAPFVDSAKYTRAQPPAEIEGTTYKRGEVRAYVEEKP